MSSTEASRSARYAAVPPVLPGVPTATGPHLTTTRTTEGTTARVRASDAEREATVGRLHQALGEGRLDLAETDVRVAAAYATVYRSDLPSLVADLPGSAPLLGPAAPPWADIWTLIIWRARLVLLGDRALGSPTPRHRRIAALLTIAVVVWMLVCAVVGAAMAGA